MPIFRYFCCVGAGLLALLFLADARLPRPEPRADAPHHANIRIASQVIGPQAITFGGQTVDYGIAPAMEVVDFSVRATDPRKQAFAQAEPEATPQQPAAKPVPQRSRKRYAKRNVHPVQRPPFADPMQPRLAEVWSWPRF